jgi:hypothetical protein
MGQCSAHSPVFDRQSRGSINGYRLLTLRRAELVVVRITATISIARQGPPAFRRPAGGPTPTVPFAKRIADSQSRGVKEATKSHAALFTFVSLITKVRVMSLFDVLAIWISSNFGLVGLLVWHRVIVPRRSYRQIVNHQNAARSIDDLQGVVWG